MSKASRERYIARTEYFAYLKETAELVDPYVHAHIEKQFGQLPWLRNLIIGRYRFGQPQLRPATVRMAYELAGGDDWRQIIPACAAVEAKDTGYYCYDEMLDVSGIDSSLLITGQCYHDMAWSIIEEMVGITSHTVVMLHQEIHALDLGNANGVKIEAEMAKSHCMDMGKYMERVRGYNFWEYAFRIGAILARASAEKMHLIAKIGQLIGMAYIVANDTWEFGKDDLEDFQAGKMTLPIIYALEHADESCRTILGSFHGRRLAPEFQDEVRTIIVKCGAIDHGKRKAWELCRQALTLLEAFGDSNVRRVIEFSTTATQRNRYFDKLDLYR